MKQKAFERIELFLWATEKKPDISEDLLRAFLGFKTLSAFASFVATNKLNHTSKVVAKRIKRQKMLPVVKTLILEGMSAKQIGKQMGWGRRITSEFLALNKLTPIKKYTRSSKP
jgi:hypothetical protein